MFHRSPIAEVRNASPDWPLPVTGVLAILAASLVIPGGLLLAIGVATAAGLGSLVAELRRHGDGGVPALPFALED